MTFIDRVLPKVIGKNLDGTSKETILDQMGEPRELPMGRRAFEEWSDRIIAGAMLPGGAEDPAAFIRSQKWVLANGLLHIGPTESHKPDAYFIHHLRVSAIKQMAVQIGEEIRMEGKRILEEKVAQDVQNVPADNGAALPAAAAGGGPDGEGIGRPSPRDAAACRTDEVPSDQSGPAN